MVSFQLQALFLLVAGASAFTPRSGTFAGTKKSLHQLRMSEETEAEQVSISSKSGYDKKEILYDEKTGRFFESSAPCDPDDEFCAVDPTTGDLIRLSLEEKERIFMDAMQSYYASGKQILEDEEFDMLKEDLVWAGSELVSMNRKETKYLNAMQAYLKGNPIMSDAEFDALKAELKEDGSSVAVQTDPQCYLDTGVCKVTLKEDNFRSNLLYLPMGLSLGLAWLGLGYEIFGAFIKINPIILAALGSPLIFKYSKDITENIIFKNFKIAYGPCPSCEAENRVYFGDILGVEGFGDQASVKCKNCKQEFVVLRSTLRATTLPKKA